MFANGTRTFEKITNILMSKREKCEKLKIIKKDIVNEFLMICTRQKEGDLE